MNDNQIVRPMIDREPDPWQAEIINALSDCTRRFIQLGRVANQHDPMGHGMQAVEAVKFAAYVGLLAEALDELLTKVIESGNKRLAVLPLGHNRGLLQEELFATINAFVERGAVDGMAGYAFLRQKYIDDIEARYPS